MLKDFLGRYYHKNKQTKKIPKEFREKYQNLPEKEKEIKQQYGCERYKRLSENKGKC